jgi:hypothetical protein
MDSTDLGCTAGAATGKDASKTATGTDIQNSFDINASHRGNGLIEHTN